MHGPPLTPDEVRAKLERHARHYRRRGLDEAKALRMAAEDHGANPERVRALLGSEKQ